MEFESDDVAWKLLMENLWWDDRGILKTNKPRATISNDEWDAVDFLRFEYDYDFQGLETEKNDNSSIN